MLLRVMVRVPLLLIGSLIMATVISPRLALLFLVLMPLIAVVIGVIIRIAYPIFKVVQQKLDGLNTVMQENLAGVRVVRVFARAGHETTRFKTANADLRDTTLSVIKYVVIVMPVLMLIMFLSMLVMRFARAEASAGRVNEVLDSVPDVTNPPVAIERFRPRGQVVFDNVSFAYDSDSEPVL